MYIYGFCFVSGVMQGYFLGAILFYYRWLYMQIGMFCIRTVICSLQGITVPLDTVI